MGNPIDALYGKIQIQVIIKNGKLQDIKIIDYPKETDYSEQLNNQALPQLIQETINLQNININTISGATETSNGFIKSLKSALKKAN